MVVYKKSEKKLVKKFFFVLFLFPGKETIVALLYSYVIR